MQCANPKCDREVKKPAVKFCCRDCNVSHYNNIAKQKRKLIRSTQAIKCANPECTEKFIKEVHNQKYCSSHCKAYFLRKRWMKLNPEKVRASNYKQEQKRQADNAQKQIIITCHNCKKPFTNQNRHNIHRLKYCSNKCRRDSIQQCRDVLPDWYVRHMFRLHKDECPPGLIELKRLEMKIKRSLKQKLSS